MNTCIVSNALGKAKCLRSKIRVVVRIKSSQLIYNLLHQNFTFSFKRLELKVEVYLQYRITSASTLKSDRKNWKKNVFNNYVLSTSLQVFHALATLL